MEVGIKLMPIQATTVETRKYQKCANLVFSSSSSPLSSLLYRAKYGFGGSSSSLKSPFLAIVAAEEGVGPLLPLRLVGGVNDVPKPNFGGSRQQSNE